MFIDKNSIQIRTKNGSFVSMGKYLVEVEYGYNKLWSSDSGRNLAGKMTGTLVGIFPKLTLHFRKLTRTELQALTPILDAGIQYVKYYDPYKKATITIETYTGDWSVSNKGVIRNATKTTAFGNGSDNAYKNEGFSISFIARSKRT